MTDDRADRFGPRYYEEHADALGWGAGNSPDPFKLALLEAEVRGSPVLDLGCGPGVYSSALAKAGRRVIGVDQSRGLLAAGHARHAELSCAGALRLPFRDRSFETTLVLSILEHVDDVALFAEAARVTRGRIIAQVPLAEPAFLADAGLLFSHWADRSHLRTYTPESLERLAAGAGWRVVAVHPAFPRDVTELYLAALSTARPVRRVVRALLGRLRPWVVNPPAECFVVAEPR